MMLNHAQLIHQCVVLWKTQITLEIAGTQRAALIDMPYRRRFGCAAASSAKSPISSLDESSPLGADRRTSWSAEVMIFSPTDDSPSLARPALMALMTLRASSGATLLSPLVSRKPKGRPVTASSGTSLKSKELM